MAFVYLFFFNDHGLPPLIRLAISILAAYVGFYLPNIFVQNMHPPSDVAAAIEADSARMKE